MAREMFSYVHPKDGEANPMPGLYRYAALLFVVVAVLQAHGVEAAVVKQGRLLARAGGPISNDVAISVESNEGDNRSAALTRVISQSLVKQGFQVSDLGDLKFEFRVDNYDIATKPASSFEAEDDSGSSGQTRGESLQQALNEPEGDSRPQGLGHLHIEFFLFKNGHPPIWTATIDAPRDDQDEDRQLKRMVSRALDAFGKTEDSQFDVFE
jgi:hypothetical protein